jgi:hypothetical protein
MFRTGMVQVKPMNWCRLPLRMRKTAPPYGCDLLQMKSTMIEINLKEITVRSITNITLPAVQHNNVVKRFFYFFSLAAFPISSSQD